MVFSSCLATVGVCFPPPHLMISSLNRPALGLLICTLPKHPACGKTEFSKHRHPHWPHIQAVLSKTDSFIRQQLYSYLTFPVSEQIKVQSRAEHIKFPNFWFLPPQKVYYGLNFLLKGSGVRWGLLGGCGFFFLIHSILFFFALLLIYSMS